MNFRIEASDCCSIPFQDHLLNDFVSYNKSYSHLYIYPSLFLTYLSIYLSIYLSQSVPYLSIYLSIPVCSLSIYLSIPVSSLSIYLSCSVGYKNCNTDEEVRWTQLRHKYYLLTFLSQHNNLSFEPYIYIYIYIYMYMYIYMYIYFSIIHLRCNRKVFSDALSLLPISGYFCIISALTVTPAWLWKSQAASVIATCYARASTKAKKK